jgi:hypothetical protein
MIGFIGTSLQLQPIIINYNNSDDCLRLAPFLIGLRVSSTVTDLVLIYESVTSSASVVRWLALHIWTLNCLMTESLNSLTNQSIHECPVIYNAGQTEERPPPRTVRVLLCYYVFILCYAFTTFNLCIHGNVVRTQLVSENHVFRGNALARSSEPLSSNGLFLHNIVTQINLFRRYAGSIPTEKKQGVSACTHFRTLAFIPAFCQKHFVFQNASLVTHRSETRYEQVAGS